jgi:hypothetical protein
VITAASTLTHVLYLLVIVCTKVHIDTDKKLAYASVQILGIILYNMFIYCTFYVTMKLMCGERPTPRAWSYFLAWCLAAGAGIYFFIQKEYNLDTDSASSRELNEACILLDFYNKHDVWHFLSAGGLYLYLMFLLHIDEDIKHWRRSQIVVF